MSEFVPRSLLATPVGIALPAAKPIDPSDAAARIPGAGEPGHRKEPSANGTLEADRRAQGTPLENYLIALWNDVLGGRPIDPRSNFFESGGDSLLGLRIINRLRESLGEHISLVVLFEAPTIAALAKLLETHYAPAVAKLCGRPPDDARVEVSTRPLDEHDVERMRRIVGHKQPPAAGPRTEKNPPAVFILSPMRSGSTLLRIMLAGHPRLFSPPELQLLQFNTLAERRDALTGYERYMQEGTVRAWMQIHGVDLATAQTAMAAREDAGWDVRRFYREMQAAIAPRLLVDKTPDYAMDLATLRDAEAFFDGALYIHLARHPLGMIRSYEQGHFLLESPYRGRHDFSARQMAELTWLLSHRNISEFLREVPAARQRLVRFEDVVSEPSSTMQALGEFLGVGYDPGMVQPYENGPAKMTDGAHDSSVQVGDHNFQRHGGLNPEVAGKWRAEYREDFLSAATWEIAARFGYENPFGPRGSAPAEARTPPAAAARTLPSIMAVSRDARRVRRSVLTGE